MKQVGKLKLYLLIGLIGSSFCSCDDGETEIEPLCPSYFYINDTSDSLFVSFHYSYKENKEEWRQGDTSYFLGIKDTLSFLYGEVPNSIYCADTISMKNSMGEYMFFRANYGSFWNEKYYKIQRGNDENRYYFIDDSTLAKCDTMLKN